MCHVASTNSLHTERNTSISPTLTFQTIMNQVSLTKGDKNQVAHLNHEVILFLHLTDTSHYLLVTCVHGTRVHTQGRCGEVQVHPIVIVTPPAAVSRPVADAIVIYSKVDKQNYYEFSYWNDET